MVDVIGVDAGLLDGLAEQAVQNDGVVFELPQGTAQPRRQLELVEIFIRRQRRPDVPFGDRLQHPVLGGVALGDQFGGQLLGERLFPEALQAGPEA